MERCPVCSRQVPASDITSHVNVCLDDVQLGRERVASGSWSAQILGPDAAVRQRSAVELQDMQHASQDLAEWPSFDYSLERIDLSSRGGGVLFARVLGVQILYPSMVSAPTALSSCFPIHAIRRTRRPQWSSSLLRACFFNRSLLCSLEFEAGEWKTEEKRPITCVNASQRSQLYPFDESFLVPVHDYYGPLCLHVDVQRPRLFRTPQGLGTADIRLYDARAQHARLLEHVNALLSITDPIRLADSFLAKLVEADRQRSRRHQRKGKKAEMQKAWVVPDAVLGDSKSAIAKLFSLPQLFLLHEKDEEGKPLPHRANQRIAGVWFDAIYLALDSLIPPPTVVPAEEGEQRSSAQRSNKRYQCSQIPLMHVVAVMNSYELANYIIQHGSYQPGSLYGGRTAVHIAALCGHVQVLRELLIRDAAMRREDFDFNFGIPADLNRNDVDYLSALHYAVLGAELHTNALHVIDILDGEESNAADSEGRTPLMLLCQRSRGVQDPCSIASRLIRLGANPLSRDRHGDTPLIASTRSGDLAMMRWLIGANPHALNMYNNAGQHPMTVAAEMSNKDAVQLLLDSKALPWASPVDGKTPLHVLAARAEVEIAEILCRHLKSKSVSKLGEMLLLRDHAGRMARHIAQKGCTAEHKKMLLMLQKYHSCVEGRSEFEPSGSLLSRAATDDGYRYFETVAEAVDYKEGEFDVELREAPVGVAFAEQCEEEDVDMHRRSHSIVAHTVFEEEAAASEHLRQVKEVASVLQAMAHEDFTAKPHLEALIEGPLHVPISTAAILLRHFRWNMEKLLSSFAENALETCEAAGLTLRPDPSHPATAQSSCENRSSSSVFVCSICMEKFPADGGFALICGHRFDEHCWRGHLRAKLADGPSCVFASCPAADCREVVPEDAWEEIFQGFPELLERYSFFLIRSYIELNPSLKWCPSPKCNKAVFYTGVGTDLRCDCGFKMCFQCSEAAHSPADCEMMRRWRVEHDAGGINADFIVKTSRLCPRCSVPISRISGCNHIRCKMCDHEFCWLCCGPWQSHGDATGGFYECNLYDEAEVESHTRSHVLGRFVHYYTRFEHHQRGQQDAVEARLLCSKQLDSEREEYARLKLTQCVAALLQLEESRRVLAFSYVFAYYMPEPSHQHLFEHLQEMLEKHAEYLHELVLPVSENNDVEVSADRIRNYTNLTRQFTGNLVDGVQQYFGQCPGHNTTNAVPPSTFAATSSTSASAPHSPNSRSNSSSSNAITLGHNVVVHGTGVGTGLAASNSVQRMPNRRSRSRSRSRGTHE